MSSMSVPLQVKWNKETLTLEAFDPKIGVKGLKSELSEKTGVPVDRMKLMAKSKGLWKGVLKDDVDLTALNWQAALTKNGGKPLSLLLMGSATTVVAPTTKTVFLEDLPPEEVAKVQEPSGLINLGNTCYLNSVVQCLRAVQPLRQALTTWRLSSDRNGTTNAAATLLVTSLADTLHRLDAQVDPVQPAPLVQATKLTFPHFAQTGPQGQPMQQDAEEFYSQLMTVLAESMRSEGVIQAGFENISGDGVVSTVSQDELQGASNLVDAVFGIQMKEILTCDELTTETTDSTNAAATEAPVVRMDLARKLVCNIQGGSDQQSAVNVSHLNEGISLSLNGKIEKHSETLGRDAVWSRAQRISRLPPILAVQFGRFYWKATPDSADHAGVKCKVMKPVAFSGDLDVYDFCTPEIQAILKSSRDKALRAQEEAIQKKLQGKDDGDDKDVAMQDANDTSKMEEEGEEEEAVDEDLQAALALSLEEKPKPVGPGLPDDFQGYYELFAVVTHKGRDADGGHYMAWVKAKNQGTSVQKIADSDQDNEDWYVFDDDEVSPCKTEDVLKLKGGGDWHMAYLSFYRAKK